MASEQQKKEPELSTAKSGQMSALTNTVRLPRHSERPWKFAALSKSVLSDRVPLRAKTCTPGPQWHYYTGECSLCLGREFSLRWVCPKSSRGIVKSPAQSRKIGGGAVTVKWGGKMSNYWSATTNANNTNNAWCVNFNNGNDNNNNKSDSRYVRGVRSGQ